MGVIIVSRIHIKVLFMYHIRYFGMYPEDFCTWTHVEQLKIRLRPIVLIFHNWYYTLKPNNPPNCKQTSISLT